MKTARGKTHEQFHPSLNSVNDNNDWHGKLCLLVQHWYECYGVTKYPLIGFSILHRRAFHIWYCNSGQKITAGKVIFPSIQSATVLLKAFKFLSK